MSTTKSINSNSSRARVSELIRRVATSVFPSIALRQDDSLTDESSFEDDDRQLSAMFDREGYSNRNVFRSTSRNTENDSASCYSGQMGTPMDEYAETDGRSRMHAWNDEPNEVSILFPVSFLNSNEGHDVTRKRSTITSHRNRNQNSKHHRQKKQLCDNTTMALLVLCTVLTLILGILTFVLDPTLNTNNVNNNNNNNNNNNGQPSIPNTNYTFVVPTMEPVINIGTNSPPTMNQPASKPISIPAARPTASVPTNNNIDKPKVPPLSMGPMLGHTTHDSVTLWAYHEFTNDAIEVLLYDYDTDVLLRKVDFIASRTDRNNAFLETIKHLKPSTSYKFGMHIRGERVGKGSFTTAPLPNSNNGTQFDYILASCMNYRQYKNQIVWDVIKEKLGRYPDFSILAGDTVYLQEGVDVTNESGVNFDRLWLRNQEQRNEPHFAEFIRNVPTYSTWNDHEYGTNDADKDQRGKLNSLKAWESLWPNPGYGDENTNDGIYYSYYWGDVHYIVTDDHWYRDTSLGNRLGVKQTQWIENELINSEGTFKVIVIGSDIMQRSWSSDLNNIGDIVRENRINGVVFHAGDIHRNEYKEMITGGFPYPVKQITSSGIAKVWRRPFVHIRVDTTVDDPSMTAFFYGASSTAQITTWNNDPSLVCSSVEGIDRTKEHTCTETIRLSDLTLPSR